MGPRQVSFVNVYIVFFVVAFICKLLIPLLLNWVIVVAVNGHDEIEIWNRAYKLYSACNTAIGLELEEAFISTAREEMSDSIKIDFMKRLRSLRYSDFLFTLIGR